MYNFEFYTLKEYLALDLDFVSYTEEELKQYYHCNMCHGRGKNTHIAYGLMFGTEYYCSDCIKKFKEIK